MVAATVGSARCLTRRWRVCPRRAAPRRSLYPLKPQLRAAAPPPPPPPPLPPVLQDNEGPRHTRLHSKHVVTGITEQRCESHETRTPSRAGICLDLCAARQIHTRTTLPHEPGRNNGNITSPALQSRRVTSSCGCVKRRGLKPRPSLDSSLHPQCGWRVGACRSLG